MGYLRDTIKGFGWMGGFRVVSRSVALVRTGILARILIPAQFGVYGIATLILAFLETFTETGINIFLIQEKERIDKYVDTAWIVSILRGFIIALFTLASIPLVVSFFSSPEVTPLLILVAGVSAVRGFINPARVVYQKQLQFGKEFWFRTSVFVADSATAIIVSLATRSAIGLVWGLMAGAVVELVLSHTILSPKPKLALDTAKFKKIVKRGKWVTMAGIFSYLTRQGDDAIVGKLLNTASLGLYQMAYRISTLPVTEVADVAGKVTFPIYVKIKGDKLRLRKAFLKTAAGVSTLAAVGGLVIFVFPELIVKIILGDMWLAAVPTLRILTVFGVISAVTGVGGSLFFALKKQNYVSAITAVRFVTLALVIIPLTLRFGIEGAAYSTIIAVITPIPLIIYYLRKTLY